MGTYTRMLVTSLLLTLAAVAGNDPLSAQRGPGTLVSLEVSGDDVETFLALETDHLLDWRANWLRGDVLQFSLPGSRARSSAVGLAPAGTLIDSVDVYRAEDEGVASTLLEISLRAPVAYSMKEGETELQLRFRPRVNREFVEPSAPERPATADVPRDSPMPSPDERSGEYRIGPGDLLEISVFGLDDFDRTVRVLRDGSISLPLLGMVGLGQMTVRQAEQTVARLLTERRLVNAPQVGIFVKDYVSRGISVQGAVERPGVYQMIEQRTLLEVLGEAGGLSGRENDRAGQKILVIRKTMDGEQRRIEVDAEMLVNQGRADLNIPLLPGDVVLVPFAQKYRVYVSGAVNRPGPVEYLSSEGITVLQAITAAGGSTERGNLANVEIVRRLPDGTETRIDVNVKRIQRGREEDLRLERNDTVIVGEWFF